VAPTTKASTIPSASEISPGGPLIPQLVVTAVRIGFSGPCYWEQYDQTERFKAFFVGFAAFYMALPSAAAGILLLDLKKDMLLSG